MSSARRWASCPPSARPRIPSPIPSRSSCPTRCCSLPRHWAGGARGLGLLRLRTQLADRAHRTLRRRGADAAAVQHEIPRRLHPVLPRIERPQLLLDAVGSLPGEAEPGGDALDVAVDGDRWNPKGVPEDDRCGLATDASEDRKSTRLNSSHGYISYPVFCLKKKKYTG